MSSSDSPITNYAHPAVTVDTIVFSIREDKLQVILIKRGIEPFKGDWALPGGFVRMDETLEAAATRELQEEAGIGNLYLEQLYTFGDLDRDPRGRVVTIAYMALVSDPIRLSLRASTDAADAAWFAVDQIPELAFDHTLILDFALKRLRAKLEYSTIAYALLPDTFTLTQLQKIYQIILGEVVDKRNFRKRMLSLDLLETAEGRHGGAHRPAQLYRFKEKVLKFIA